MKISRWLWLLFVPSVGLSVEHYVAPGGHDSGAGSAQHPWATIQYSVNQAKPGDTVVVADGTYQETVLMQRGGAPQARVIVKSRNKWGAKIAPRATPNHYAVMIDVDVDYVTFQDFEITAQPDSLWGIKLNGNHDRIVGNKIHDIGNSDKICPSGAAILVGGDYANNDTELNGNWIYNISPSRNAPIRCNKMHGIYLTNDGGTIVNNIIFQVWQGFGIHLYGHVANWTISNNTVFNTGDDTHKSGGAYYVSCGPEPVSCDHIVVSNNIFARTQNSCIWQDPSGGTMGPNNVLISNLVYECAPNYWGVKGSLADSVLADPMFVRYTGDVTGDYHLKAKSPALRRGVSSTAPRTDIEGGPRPAQQSPDIGAFQTEGL